MSKWLAPVVAGPIFSTNTVVFVTDVLEGAEIRLLSNGRAVGTGQATRSGTLAVKISGGLNQGEGVVASQRMGGDESPPSNTAVPS